MLRSWPSWLLLPIPVFDALSRRRRPQAMAVRPSRASPILIDVPSERWGGGARYFLTAVFGPAFVAEVEAGVVRVERTVLGFDETAASAASVTGFAMGVKRASWVTCWGPSSSSVDTSSSVMVRTISLRRISIVLSTPRRPPAMRPYR